MIDTSKKKERYILVSIYDESEEKAEALIEELSFLTDTAGGEPVCKVLQHL
jgi:hypothetical protein